MDSAQLYKLIASVHEENQQTTVERQEYPAAFPRARVLASHIQARYGIEAWLPLEAPVGDGEIEALPNAHKTYNDTFDWASRGSEKIESSKKKNYAVVVEDGDLIAVVADSLLAVSNFWKEHSALQTEHKGPLTECRNGNKRLTRALLFLISSDNYKISATYVANTIRLSCNGPPRGCRYILLVDG